MAAKSPKEVFVMLLSHARQNTERSIKVYQELSEIAQNPDVKEALEARAFVSNKDLSQIDQCFKLIGEAPVKPSGRVYEVFVEDFRRELAEIQNPAAKLIFVLARASQFTHLQIAEFTVLTAAADLSGHYAVGVLLESCLADRLAFVERTRRFLRNMVEKRVAERIAA
ncbi:MAG TPA: DUF892 family protein [Candidatus Angelobacter sp.]